MFVSHGPVDHCGGFHITGDLEPAEIAALACDHLERHHVEGRALIEKLTSVEIDGAQPGVALVRTIDQPLIAVDRGGRRHATGPGPVSLDGRGPARCVDWHTVQIVDLPVFGGPARASAQREPGTVQPDCKTCRRRLR
ncbi:hypothetical protein [Jiangella alba]|uniref:hypothetical protein n=1 Tax=Jiangella alba TaxID=561176 RepID=UPI00114CB005|nr:hypothetical protein [Jiangella alba]